jgi:DNA-binding MarR family transcriptional regulator
MLSTKFTRLALDDAPSAPLTVLLQTASHWVMQGLMAALSAKGYAGLTEAHLTLLGNLDCGTTHASAVAQRIGLSRQAIYRTIREMEAMGFLVLQNDMQRRNQKLVVMTEVGMHLALDARATLATLEDTLAQRIGADALAALRVSLEQSWGDVG